MFGTETLEPESLHLRTLSGREELSRLFELTVEIQPLDDVTVIERALDGMLSAPAHVGRAGEDAMLHGIVRDIELQPYFGKGTPSYRLTLVPRLWTLTQTRRSRIFQEQTVPQIVLAVLQKELFIHDEDFEMRLRAKYPSRDYTVQWDETDFAFISRLLEADGIAYFFDHSRGRDRVIFFDSADGARREADHESVPYDAQTPQGTAGIVAWSRVSRRVPRGVMMLDYNWRAPMLELEESATVVGGTTGVVHTSDEAYRESENGERLAKIRAEEIAARRCVHRGKSSMVSLRAGDVLSIQGHPFGDLDREYLVVSVSHELRQARPEDDGSDDNFSYANELEAIALDVPFRPMRITPRPTIHGCTYATIDAPDTGAAAPIDDQGRYKVLLPFDPIGPGTGRATRWIRMAQPLAGSGYGFHFPLRVGTEVVLAYLHGDPDRPVIVGALPNTLTPSPVVQANATASVVKTSSGIRIEFEDNA